MHNNHCHQVTAHLQLNILYKICLLTVFVYVCVCVHARMHVHVCVCVYMYVYE
jgi:hypothetical protein